MEKNFLLLIDGSSLLSTQFFGNLPKQILFAKTLEEKETYFHKILQTDDGFYTNGVYGFVKYLFKLIKDMKPSHLAVTWDLTRDTFRKKIYPAYKGNRSETLAPLADQFSICEEVLNSFGIAQFMSGDFEADDFCGSIAARFENEIPVYILTKDNDYLQLVNDKTTLWLMHASADKTDELYKKYKLDKTSLVAPDRTFPFNPGRIREEFGIEAKNVNSLKGIMGDSSDNIKGVVGVGEATATLLIAHYKTVDNLYRDITGKTKKELEEIKTRWKEELGIKRSPLSYLLKESDTELVGEKAARLSEELATIKRDIDLGKLELQDLALGMNRKNTLRTLASLQFGSIRLDGLPQEVFSEQDRNYKNYDLNSAIEEGVISENGRRLIENLRAKTMAEPLIEKEEEVRPSFKKEVIGTQEEVKEFFKDSTKFSASVGFFFHEKGLNLTFDSSDIELLSESEEIFSLITEGFIGLIKERKDIRFVTFHLKEQFPFLKGNSYENLLDMAVAHYLLNPLSTSHNPLDVLKDYPMLFFEEDCEHFAKSAFLVSDKLLSELSVKGMKALYYQIEMPLVTTLYEMEVRGVKINRNTLKEFGEELDGLISEYEKNIYEMAGETFNINSPKQLGIILFEVLKLPHGKKTKSGYSTSADVLEKIKYEDPIVVEILKYRQVAKLKSTYTDGLESYIREDGRIHSKLNQLVTATGRLSSTEPNLQNIPIRTELGKKIRKAFVPEEGFVFIDADYSQIELRIMAHLSDDEELISAYQSAEDIHRITAAKVFRLPYSEVTNEERRKAKAVNFGILYGISSFGLGENLGIGRKEAETYIKDYFTAYPKVKKYLDDLVAKAKEEGFVTTYFGRIRPIPELESNNFMQRQFGERIAMNSPVQGTSADIIKIAMNRINDRLKQEFPSSRLLLQIHDELLIEAKEEDKEEVARLVHEEMLKAVSLKVPLEADIKMGYNWFDSH